MQAVVACALGGGAQGEYFGVGAGVVRGAGAVVGLCQYVALGAGDDCAYGYFAQRGGVLGLLQGELQVVEVAGCVGWRWLGWHGLLLGLGAWACWLLCWLIARFAACFFAGAARQTSRLRARAAALAGAGWVG